MQTREEFNKDAKLIEMKNTMSTLFNEGGVPFDILAKVKELLKQLREDLEASLNKLSNIEFSEKEKMFDEMYCQVASFVLLAGYKIGNISVAEYCKKEGGDIRPVLTKIREEILNLFAENKTTQEK